MINVKFDGFMVYAKRRMSTADRIFYDAWLSVGNGLKRQESATVTLSVARQADAEDAELIQHDLDMAMTLCPDAATPKKAFAYLERVERADKDRRFTV